MDSAKFGNEAHFMSFAAIIATRNGTDGSNFHIRNTMTAIVEVSGNRLVCIVACDRATVLPNLVLKHLPVSSKFILTMDVKSLYTVIPYHGLRALKFFLDKRPNQEPSTSVLVRLAELVLTLNNFSFDGEHYQQISGVAMGTKMGPNYANLFVGFVEKQIFEQYTDPIPDYLGRYIDDCVGTASCSRGKLECFINYVNNFHSALQFTWEIRETSVSFLDILVSINGNRLTTSVFYKPTDSHSYLLIPTTPSSPFLSLSFIVFAAFAMKMKTFNPKAWK